MKRKTTLLLGLIDRLCEEIDKNTELTISERLFFEDKTLDPKITEKPKEREEIKRRMNAIISEIQKL